MTDPIFCLGLAPQRSAVRYRGEPMFTLHQINAYEEGGCLVMDMCCGDDGAVIGDFTLENLRRGGEELDKVRPGIPSSMERQKDRTGGSWGGCVHGETHGEL